MELKTKTWYTDYVNHMIKFYLSTPDSLTMTGRSEASVMNWIAVQAVFHTLSEKDRERVRRIYELDYHIPKAVAAYCSETGADEQEVWKMITRICARIARQRKLV